MVYGNRQFNNGFRNNSGYQQQPNYSQQQQAPAPTPVPIEEQIRERLSVYQMIISQAEQMGIPKDELLMASGLTAWVTSMIGNFGRK